MSETWCKKGRGLHIRTRREIGDRSQSRVVYDRFYQPWNYGTSFTWCGLSSILYCLCGLPKTSSNPRHHFYLIGVCGDCIGSHISGSEYRSGSCLHPFSSCSTRILCCLEMVWARTMAQGNARFQSTSRRWCRNDLETLVQTKKTVDQISVHLLDGRVLYLNDRPKYEGTPWDGLYLGGDGSVLMIVEEEKLPDGIEEERKGICSDWGTRLTYLPASQITRVNIRLKWSTSLEVGQKVPFPH